MNEGGRRGSGSMLVIVGLYPPAEISLRRGEVRNLYHTRAKSLRSRIENPKTVARVDKKGDLQPLPFLLPVLDQLEPVGVHLPLIYPLTLVPRVEPELRMEQFALLSLLLFYLILSLAF